MVQFFLGGRRIGLHQAVFFMRWAVMNIMAIEDGLFPLALVTHTHTSTTVQIFLSSQNTRKQLAKLHQRCFLFEVIRLRMEMTKYNCPSRCWHGKCTCLCVCPLGLPVLGDHMNYVHCVTIMFTVARWIKWKKKQETRINQRSTPHGSTGCRHHCLTRLSSITRWADPTSLHNMCCAK